MNDGLLTQEEIDSLLRGESVKTAPQPANASLNDIERDTLGEIGNISMGTSATTLSTLLRRKVSITTPRVTLTNREQLQGSYPLPYLVVEVKYREGLQGSNILVVKKEDASVIADLMMGGSGEPSNDALDELHVSAVSEAMNQMMGSATTSLSSMFNVKIDIEPPRVNVVDFGSENLQSRFGPDFDQIVQISFRMVIEDLVDSEIMQIIPLAAGQGMVNVLLGNIAEVPIEVAEPVLPPPLRQEIIQPAAAAAPPPVTQVPPLMVEPTPMVAAPAAYGYYPPGPAAYAASNINQNPVAVKPVQFAPLSGEPAVHEPKNIGLILDVPLEITVELGRTKKTIKEILEMGPGSIIQLEKLAGEPVDLLVNGKLIAKGEVVVIDETYGVRINAIISPMDRVSKLQ
ncbi:MAG: flagellar motor switch phosphatase FliY [Methylocystaceae bacterium]